MYLLGQYYLTQDVKPCWHLEAHAHATYRPSVTVSKYPTLKPPLLNRIGGTYLIMRFHRQILHTLLLGLVAQPMYPVQAPCATPPPLLTSKSH